MISSKGVFT